MKKKKIKYTITGILIVVLGILSLIVYQSYAYFKVNYTRNIINTRVGFFGQKTYEYGYTGSVQEFVVPANGYYEINLWGAGIYATALGGGYTSGNIYLNKNEILYVVVGSGNVIGLGGYNGGGANGIPTSSGGYSGNGATDIRLIKASSTDNTLWNESVSLRSRIMVAAGGGGPGCVTSGCVGTDPNAVLGGYGGGLIGGRGSYNVNWGGPSSTTLATQTSGYQFGVGGPGLGPYSNTGGGGGYYGGVAGVGKTRPDSAWAGGGGGSSYISGYSGVNSVQEIGGTVAQPLHTNNTIHYSGKYFLKGSMEAGVNTGNGKAKITYVSSVLPQRTNTNLDNVRYIKSCSTGNNKSGNYVHWNEIQAIKDGENVAYGKIVTGTHTVTAGQAYTNITDGITTEYSQVNTSVNSCVTVDLGAVYNLDEIGIFRYYNDGRIYMDNVLSVGETNVSGTTSLSTILHNYPGTTGYAETSQGKRYTAWD